MLQRVWPVGLAKAKDQEGQTTGDGHPKGMWLQWRIVHKTLSHEMFSLTPLKLNLDFLFISFILRRFKLKFQFTFSVSYLSCRIVLQIKNFMLTRLLVNRQYSILPIKKVNIANMKIWVHPNFVLVHLRKKLTHARVTWSFRNHSNMLIYYQSWNCCAA